MTNVYPTGLLWQQGEGRDWREEVAAAAARFRERFWIEADTCVVRRETIRANDKTINLNDDVQFIGEVAGLAVFIKDSDLQPGHFFVFNSVVVDPTKPERAAKQKRVSRIEPELVQGELF